MTLERLRILAGVRYSLPVGQYPAPTLSPEEEAYYTGGLGDANSFLHQLLIRRVRITETGKSA